MLQIIFKSKNLLQEFNRYYTIKFSKILSMPPILRIFSRDMLCDRNKVLLVLFVRYIYYG